VTATDTTAAVDPIPPTTTAEPACEWEDSCPDPVTHLDQSGFVYCTRHGLIRRSYRPCRKLRPHEVNRLRRGELLSKY
jgi:hypothetical protein